MIVRRLAGRRANPRRDAGTASTSTYQFTGRELDPNSGLYYLRNRYYSPTLQRFISPDPAGLAGGDVNLYAYAHNDPTNLTDPLGLFSSGAVGGGGGDPWAVCGDVAAANCFLKGPPRWVMSSAKGNSRVSAAYRKSGFSRPLGICRTIQTNHREKGGKGVDRTGGIRGHGKVCIQTLTMVPRLDPTGICRIATVQTSGSD